MHLYQPVPGAVVVVADGNVVVAVVAVDADGTAAADAAHLCGGLNHNNHPCRFTDILAYLMPSLRMPCIHGLLKQ